VSDSLDDLEQMLGRAKTDFGVRPDPLDPARIAARRRRTIRRRIATGVVALVIAAVVGTYLPLTLLAPLGTSALTIHKPDFATPAAVTLSLPGVGASAISVAGAEHFAGTTGTDGILASSGGNGALPIASISKLVTALVVLDARPLKSDEAGPTLAFGKPEADLYDKYYVLGATVSSMRTGTSMSEHDAIEVMLVASACNYAEVVSTWAFGSQAKFLSATRTWLKAHGLAGTTIVEPTGIDARNVSTPTDLIAIGKLAMANPVLATIVGSPSVTVPIGTLANNNKLLGTDGINGIKTGTLAKAGSCLLFSAVVDVGIAAPLTVIGVVLGGSDHSTVDSAVRDLIGSIKSGFHRVPLLAKGQVLGSYSTPWKDDATIVAGDDATVLTWSNNPITSTMVTTSLTTGADGATVGSVTFVAGEDTVTVPLLLHGAIAGPDAWWRLTHPAELLGK
jgi:D-alanyl-D-alanine carboxypeptidase (penicillin-binding protein 5/6)